MRAAQRLFLVLFGLYLVASASTAQNSSGLFFDTVDVNVVNLEVIVTDKDGQPVTGLTRDDFEIFEDGRPVELSNFFAVEKREAVLDLGDGPAPDIDVMEMGEPVEPETKRLNLVIFVDNVNIEPRNRNMIFEQLRKYLREELDPRDQVMLAVLRDTVEIEQDFTNDVGLLESALDGMEKDLGSYARFASEMFRFMNELQRVELVDAGEQNNYNRGGAVDDPEIDFQMAIRNADRLAITAKDLAEQRYRLVQATINALGQFTDTLAGLPGRKAVLYVSDGLHVRPGESLSEAWHGHFQGWLIRNSGDVRMGLVEQAGRQLEMLKLDSTRDFKRLVEYASGNKVAFYPLSNLGSMGRSHVSAEYQGSNSETGQGALSSGYNTLDTMSREGSLLQMAEGTGGVAFTRTTNIGSLMAAMSKDFETFYSLGYNSPSPSNDNKFHKIEVKVRRDGVKVRHFEGHLAKDPLDHLQALTLSALHYGRVDNPLEVRLDVGEQTRVKGKRFNVPFTVQIPFGKLLLVPEETVHSGRVSLFVVVRDEGSGGVSKPQHIELPIQVPNDRIFDAISQAVGYPLTLELEEGRKTVAIGVRDNLARLDATLQLDVMVGGDPVSGP